ATAAGAQVLLKGGALHGVHVTLAGDTATHASGVHVTANAMNAGAEAGAMLALTNTILVSHTLGLNVNVGNTATLTGVLWYGNVTAAAGGGALAVSRAVTGSPHFVSLSHNDYHLAEDSAAIDAGVATAIARDCDGEWRDAAPDLGADEWTGVCRPLAGLSVQGATSGVAGAPLGFAGVVTPFNVALPVTYTWRATAQLPVTQSGGSAVTVAFTWQLAGTKTVTVTAVNACGTVVAATHQVAVSAGPKQTFLPLLQRSYRPACTPIPGVSYEALWVDRGGAPPPDAEHDPGYNLGLLDYEVTDAYKGLVNYGGDTDPHAPQLVHLFGPPRLPVFSEVYRLYHAYGQPITDWPVTMAGFEVSPLEIIHLPESGYRIEPSTDHQALVIYASEDRIAFNYGRRDTLAGYTIYVDGICVEPTLLALYRQLDAEGRVYLPALSGGEPFGRAHDVEIRVVIRDCGSAMDPRARKDWWKGF
ncbi:MAG: hypothetical protein JXB35_09405, partial [Anaerolineae bacterium]|nr:hypothetical protein [Anaerolineae bacterium]